MRGPTQCSHFSLDMPHVATAPASGLCQEQSICLQLRCVTFAETVLSFLPSLPVCRFSFFVLQHTQCYKPDVCTKGCWRGLCFLLALCVWEGGACVVSSTIAQDNTENSGPLTTVLYCIISIYLYKNSTGGILSGRHVRWMHLLLYNPLLITVLLCHAPQ